MTVAKRTLLLQSPNSCRRLLSVAANTTILHQHIRMFWAGFRRSGSWRGMHGSGAAHQALRDSAAAYADPKPAMAWLFCWSSRCLDLGCSSVGLKSVCLIEAQYVVLCEGNLSSSWS